MADGGDRRLNLSEVASRAGVAKSTVSRVLSDHPDVSPGMRSRVLAVVEELGYEPNVLAQSLRRGSTLSVGFALRDISSPLFSEIVLGAEIVLRSHGYAMLLTNSEGLPSLDVENIRLFRQRCVDGLLISLADERFEPVLTELERVRVPIVLIDRELPDHLHASAVVCDHRGGTNAATEHLIQLGHRRVGLVCGPLNLRPGRELKAAVEGTCLAAGCSAIVETGPFSAEYGEEATWRLLDQTDPPTALIAGSNQILTGVLRALSARDVDVPDDISLVAFDDVPLLAHLAPPVSAVSRTGLDMGQKAARLMLGMLQGNQPERVVVPTTYVPRPSCGPVKVAQRRRLVAPRGDAAFD